jgi:mono/diheme cytochrome c family protein
MIHWILRALAVPAIAIAALGCAAAQDNGTDGRALFARHCASCHGTFGEGDGPVASVMPVPNLRTLSTRSGGEFPREAVMRYIDGRELPAAHGERLMPVWGDTFAGDGEDAARNRISAITDFVEELQN